MTAPLRVTTPPLELIAAYPLVTATGRLTVSVEFSGTSEPPPMLRVALAAPRLASLLTANFPWLINIPLNVLLPVNTTVARVQDE